MPKAFHKMAVTKWLPRFFTISKKFFFFLRGGNFYPHPPARPPIQNKVNTYFINAVENTARKVPTSLGDSSNKQNETDNVKKIISEYNKRGVHIKIFVPFPCFHKFICIEFSISLPSQPQFHYESEYLIECFRVPK